MRKVKLTLLALARACGLFALARRVTRRRLKILCYHGFAAADEAEFRPQLFMRAELFGERMARLRELGYQVLPLDEAVRRLYEGTLPPDSVAITIDDGFDNTHGLAAPVLARHGFPATVYVTSYYVLHDAPVFRLFVQYLFWLTRCDLLVIAGQTWHVDARVDLRDAASRERVQNSLIDAGEAATGETERRALAVWLADALGLDHATLERSRRLHLMRPEQLRALAAMGLSVQLHTHRHRFPIDDQSVVRQEIEDNRRALADWLDGPFEHFCYPSGVWHPRQAAWLDQLGVRSSTTCLPGLNSRDTPRHGLRRFLDGQNIDPLEFESALCGFWDLVRRVR
ncbi:MAG: polysaccharide deacetylase family protein [Burkholderiales bacterium]|nr:polysaccharide deacetylase family protein [Burkholderiales bacterium]